MQDRQINRQIDGYTDERDYEKESQRKMERDIERDRKIQLEMTEIPSNETKNKKTKKLIINNFGVE